MATVEWLTPNFATDLLVALDCVKDKYGGMLREPELGCTVELYGVPAVCRLFLDAVIPSQQWRALVMRGDRDVPRFVRVYHEDVLRTVFSFTKIDTKFIVPVLGCGRIADGKPGIELGQARLSWEFFCARPGARGRVLGSEIDVRTAVGILERCPIIKHRFVPGTVVEAYGLEWVVIKPWPQDFPPCVDPVTFATLGRCVAIESRGGYQKRREWCLVEHLD